MQDLPGLVKRREAFRRLGLPRDEWPQQLQTVKGVLPPDTDMTAAMRSAQAWLEAMLAAAETRSAAMQAEAGVDASWEQRGQGSAAPPSAPPRAATAPAPPATRITLQEFLGGCGLDAQTVHDFRRALRSCPPDECAAIKQHLLVLWREVKHVVAETLADSL
jgi:hypothetical protein